MQNKPRGQAYPLPNHPRAHPKCRFQEVDLRPLQTQERNQAKKAGGRGESGRTNLEDRRDRSREVDSSRTTEQSRCEWSPTLRNTTNTVSKTGLIAVVKNGRGKACRGIHAVDSGLDENVAER